MLAAGLGEDETSDMLDEISHIDEDHRFYYTHPTTDSETIDLRPGETLDDPLKLFDANNVLRKFAVQEIDADYMRRNVTISNQSKK